MFGNVLGVVVAVGSESVVVLAPTPPSPGLFVGVVAPPPPSRLLARHAFEDAHVLKMAALSESKFQPPKFRTLLKPAPTKIPLACSAKFPV